MPKVDERFITKIEGMIARHRELGRNKNQQGHLLNIEDQAECVGWITSALTAVENICPPGSGYRTTVQRLADAAHSSLAGLIYSYVLQIASILQQLVADARAGLLVHFADTVRAETFVEFLDHGRFYLKEKRKMESGVIIGVVFEDSIRRICEKNQITQSGRPLEDLISDLQKADKLKPVQAKRARVGAHVRTKATHAQWDEFELGDVEETLRFTEDLIDQHLS